MAVLAVLTFLASHAQNQPLAKSDSLGNAIRIKRLSDCISFYDSAFGVNQQEQIVSFDEDFFKSDQQEQNTVLNKAVFRFDLQERDSTFYDDGFKLDQQEQNLKQKIFVLIFIAESYLAQKNMRKAFETFLRALKLLEMIRNNDRPKLYVLAKISCYFIRSGDLREAERYLRQGEELIQKGELSSFSKRKFYAAWGMFGNKTKNYSVSVPAYDKALALTPDSLTQEKFWGLNYMADLCYLAGEEDAAYEYLKKAEILRKSTQKDFWVVKVYTQRRRLCMRTRDRQKAIDYFMKFTRWFGKMR